MSLSFRTAITEENMNVPLCMVRTWVCKVSQKNEQNAPVITHQKSATIYLLFNYKACTTHYVKRCKKFAVLGLGLPVF
jgi:hypothetical protein